MGISTRSRSPGPYREESDSSSDEEMQTEHPDKIYGIAVDEEQISGLDSTPELLNLPGQQDIRKFLKRSMEGDHGLRSDKACKLRLVEDFQEEEPMEMNAAYDMACRQWEMDDEAALAMGLGVGMLSYDMDEYLEVDDYGWSELHRMEVAAEAAKYATEEEAARDALGLSLDIDEVPQTIADIFQKVAGGYPDSEVQDLSDLVDSSGVWGKVDFAASLARVNDLKTEEDAAKKMGHSFGLEPPSQDVDYGEIEDPVLRAAREYNRVLEEGMYEADVEAARKMGLSLGLHSDDLVGTLEAVYTPDTYEYGRPAPQDGRRITVQDVEHVMKKPRLDQAVSAPRTPPKRVLRAKATDELPAVLPLFIKRQRTSDVAQDAVSKEKHPGDIPPQIDGAPLQAN